MEDKKTLPDPSEMTEKERQERIKELLTELKALRSFPRSDYHKGFEDALQLDVGSWDESWVIREHTLGEDAPRIDFIVASGGKLPPDVKAVFKRFLRKNVIEFKGPGDKVTRLTIRKVAAYAYFYIATAKPEEDVKIGEVTATIFASEREKGLFEEMEKSGQLEKTDVKGIYLVKGIIDMPFQIVMTSEIEGAEYAAYRVLKSQVDEKDVDYLLQAMKKTTDQQTRDHLRGLLGIVEEKHTGMVLKKIEEDEKMRDVLWEYFKPQRDAEVADTTRTIYFSLVQDGDLTIDRAAQKSGMTTDQFRQQMEEYNRTHTQAQTAQTAQTQTV